MKKYQVSIKEGIVRQNGVIVAYISGMRGEKWVETIIGSTAEKPFGTDRKFFCRCKYANAAASARDFAKWAFERFSVAEVVAIGETGKAPGEWAREQGYVCYNVRQAQRRAAA